MESGRWEKVQSVFHQAAELPASARKPFLDQACGTDEILREEVLALLDADRCGAGLLDLDIAYVAESVIQGTEPPAQQVGPYRILRLLGQGGMGDVYLARRDDLGIEAAIKFLRDAWLSPARLDHFILEQRTLARLNHPSVARLYDAGRLGDGTPWFAMEYVEGAALTAYSATRNCSISERLQLFLAVCEAVNYAHSHAILHCDLKPTNIFVKDDGSVRLLDFGIARQLAPDSDGVRQTRTLFRPMTLLYAAPEQIRGERCSIQTDVYALGVVLYELLTGRLPFDPANRTSLELERMILEREPEKPSLARTAPANEGKAAWSDLDVLCATAMHKDPARRYRSVEALIRDLEHYARGEPLEARPDSVRYRAGKFIRRNARAVGATTTVAVIILALVIFFTARLAVARRTAVLEAVRTKRIQSFMLNLFDGGDKQAGPSTDLRVTDLINRGVQEAQSLSREPAVQAELYQTLGGAYQNLGNLDEADTLLQQAWKERLKLNRSGTAGVSRLDVAESEIALGLLRADQAKLEESERLVRDGWTTIRQIAPASDPALLRATTALGKVMELRGAYDQAIVVLEQMLSQNDKLGAESRELADALEELADNHFYAGHYDVCDALYQRILALHMRFYGERHPKIAEDYIDLGATANERGDYRKSEMFHRRALAIDEKFYGPDHPKTASSLTQVGRALEYQKRFPEAEGLVRRALAVQERVHGPAHPAVASALNELGNIATMTGRYAEAEGIFQRLIDIYRAVYHDRHSLIATAESNLASVYQNEKRYPPSEALYRDAIRRFAETLPANHVSIGIARVKLGRTLLRERRLGEAEEEILAGYRILSPRTSPSTAWQKAARQDMREIYSALGQPAKAREFAEPLTRAVSGQGR